jgi:hypothetical protein
MLIMAVLAAAMVASVLPARIGNFMLLLALCYGPVAIWRKERSAFASLGVAAWGLAAIMFVAALTPPVTFAIAPLLLLPFGVVAAAHARPLARNFVPCRTVAWTLLWAVPATMFTWRLGSSGQPVFDYTVGWLLAVIALGWRIARADSYIRVYNRQQPNAPSVFEPYGEQAEPHLLEVAGELPSREETDLMSRGTMAFQAPRLPRMPPSPRSAGSLRPGGAASRHPGRLSSPVWSLWLLIGILAGQAALSLRLVWANTAFGDEGLYLWAGHLEIAHWLHGARIPAFPTYFSGAPVVYPPLGAIADDLGGLAGARLLSLCFMLTATALLWATTARLFGRRAAFFAALLWGTLAPTVFLGAFATYDAMSLLLMVTAAWCAMRAGLQPKGMGWLVASAFALAAANVTKYASGIFDPVVVGIAIVTGLQVLPWKRALALGATLVTYLGALFLFLSALGGGEYVTGVTATTLARAPGNSSPSSVLAEAWQLTAAVTILAFAAVLYGFARERAWSQRLLLTLLAGSILLVPIEQAHVRTTFSLHKHVDFGAWFAAIAAGYLIDRLIAGARPRLLLLAGARLRLLRWSVVGGCVAALATLVQLGAAQATDRFHDWPNSASLITTLRYLLPSTNGPILVSTPDIPEYYLPQGTQWWRWSNLYTIRLLNGSTISSGVIGHSPGPTAYRQLIDRGFFSVVVINLRGSDVPFNLHILPAVESNAHYRLAATVPYWHSQIWLYEPSKRVTYHLLGAATPVRGLVAPVDRLNPLLGPITLAVEISGLAVVILAITIRFTWRRRKGSDEA